MIGLFFPSPKNLIEFAQNNHQVGSICFRADDQVTHEEINADNREKIRDMFDQHVKQFGRSLPAEKKSFIFQVSLFAGPSIIGSGIWEIATIKMK